MQNDKNNLQNAISYQIGNRAFLGFFNSKEVYSIKGFDTIKKANNYAKKWGYTLHTELPLGVNQFENNN